MHEIDKGHRIPRGSAGGFDDEGNRREGRAPLGKPADAFLDHVENERVGSRLARRGNVVEQRRAAAAWGRDTARPWGSRRRPWAQA